MPFLQRCKICHQKKPCIKSKCRDCTTPEDRAEYNAKKFEKAKQYKKKTLANQRANYKPTGEGELHVKLWLERPHECTGCGVKLYVMEPTVFSHTIRKKEREDLRLEPDNFELECYDCHFIWDKGTWEQIMKQKNFTKRMEYIKVTDFDLYRRKALKIYDHTGVDIVGDLG